MEYVTRVVENAPTIETVTIDTAQRQHEVLYTDKISPTRRGAGAAPGAVPALVVVRGPLLERLPPDAKLFLREGCGLHLTRRHN